MTQSVFRYNILVFTVFVLISFFLTQCKKTSNFPLKEGEGTLSAGVDTALFISFEMKTSTFISPKNTTDWDSLTQAEKILSTPVPKGCKVTQIIRSNGAIDADIEMMEFEGMPAFPEKMVGRLTVPTDLAVRRIEVREGVSTYYNAAGEILMIQNQELEDMEYLKNLVAQIGNEIKNTLTVQQADSVIQAFKSAGFDIVPDPTYPNIEYLTEVFQDGSSTRLILDKALGVIRGRMNYAEDGTLQTSSQFLYKETPAGEQVISGHWFSTFYDSPFTGIPMRINKVSVFNNLTIQH